MFEQLGVVIDEELSSALSGLHVATSMRKGIETTAIYEEAEMIQNYLKSYSEWIKRGATIAALNGELASDVGSWDMNTLAVIGFNSRKPYVIDDIEYTMDMETSWWTGTNGRQLDYSRESGLPVLPES